MKAGLPAVKGVSPESTDQGVVCQKSLGEAFLCGNISVTEGLPNGQQSEGPVRLVGYLRSKVGVEGPTRCKDGLGRLWDAVVGVGVDGFQSGSHGNDMWVPEVSEKVPGGPEPTVRTCQPEKWVQCPGGCVVLPTLMG